MRAQPRESRQEDPRLHTQALACRQHSANKGVSRMKNLHNTSNVRHRWFVNAGLTVLLMATTLVVTDQRFHAHAQSYPTQKMFFAYWSIANGYSSSIVLNNPSNIQLTVRPTLYDLTGSPLV